MSRPLRRAVRHSGTQVVIPDEAPDHILIFNIKCSPLFIPDITAARLARSNPIWPVNSVVVSHRTSGDGGQEATGDHYLNMFPVPGGVAREEELLRAKQTNGCGSSGCRGTGLLGKLQSPGGAPCHVPRPCVCVWRGQAVSVIQAGPGPNLPPARREPGISDLPGAFPFTPG